MSGSGHHRPEHGPGFRPEDWLRFVQIDPFPAQWARLGLTDAHLRALELAILAAPGRVGVVVPGTDGLRKLRFAAERSGRGKSGSLRVYYAHFPGHGTVTLLAVLAKTERSDFSKADRNALAAVIGRLRRLLDMGAIR